MKIINLMPYKECYVCKSCILSVKSNAGNPGEDVTAVRCKNENSCPMYDEQRWESQCWSGMKSTSSV